MIVAGMSGIVSTALPHGLLPLVTTIYIRRCSWLLGLWTFFPMQSRPWHVIRAHLTCPSLPSLPPPCPVRSGRLCSFAVPRGL